jgi:hypothetical protein
MPTVFIRAFLIRMITTIPTLILTIMSTRN